MYPVTTAYREQMEKPTRNYSHVRISFGVTDPDAPGASAIADNGHLFYSNASVVDMGISVPTSYHTLEKNRCVLDGKNPLAPESGYVYQGFVGEEISGDDCTFQTDPKITIAFSVYFEFAGLTMAFDASTDEWPTEIQAICKNDGVEVLNETGYPTDAHFFFDKQVPPMNEIEIIFKKTNIPHRRARLTSLIYGLVDELESGDIVSCKHAIETDIISSSLPKGEFEFTVFDTKKMYDPENPAGVWQYLESRQPVVFEIGYELDDGSIEWIPWGNTYSTGDISVGRTGAVTEVTVKTKALIAHLTQKYDEAVYEAGGISLYDLAERVMAFAGYPNTIDLDNALKTIITNAPIDSMPVNQCLQLIANAGLCIMSTSRAGTPTIKRRSGAMQNFTMGFAQLKEAPTTTKYPVLRDLTTEYRNIYLDSAVTDVVSDSNVTDASNTVFEFTHGSVTEHSVLVSSGLTVNSSAFYAQKTVLKLTGTGTVTIKGRAIKESVVKYTKHCSDVGEDLEVTNPLITSYADAVAYADWIALELSRRNEYAAPNRGYPEIDVGDTVGFVSNFENEVPVTVLKNNIEYNGAMSGEGNF